MVERAGILNSFWYLVTPASAEVALSIHVDKTLEHRPDNALVRGIKQEYRPEGHLGYGVATSAGTRSANGKSIRIVVPTSGVESTLIFPPWPSTIRLQTTRPNP